MRKVLYSLLIILSIILISNVNALDTADKIYDYADKLTDEEEKCQLLEKL